MPFGGAKIQENQGISAKIKKEIFKKKTEVTHRYRFGN